MSAIQVTARLSVHPGKLEEFRAVAGRCMESVRNKDSGTLQYDWFFSPDESECVVHETYRNSAALSEHIGNLGDTMGELLGVADMDLELYGSPSEDLVAAVTGMGGRIYSPYQSI